MARVKKLLFVDTNIWLDAYRPRGEASLPLFRHLDQISDKIIVTFQLEMEFKKNRHLAMLEGIRELKPPLPISRPGLFSDAKATQSIQTAHKRVAKGITELRARYMKALQDPAVHDPVYKICQRIFHKADKLVLTREMPERREVRRRAMKRFLLGCPPRKNGDTSIGDAFNWEWMVMCAISRNAELVIVTRDSDYGILFDGRLYANDHLRQEFAERVSTKRKLLLYNKLSDALQHFKVPVTERERRDEETLLAVPQEVTEIQPQMARVAREALFEWLEKFKADHSISNAESGSEPARSE